MRDRLCPRSACALLVLAVLLAGCGGGDEPPSPDLHDPEPAECAPGTMPLDDGGCQPAGLPPGVTAGLPPDMQCPPGETPLDDGRCQPAGVPPEACGQGFEPDGQGGCDAILPAAPCPRGQMAIPGDTQCHEVAPCGDGDYGMIPVEATTQFVNGAYPGLDSDGTRERPWKRIQQGIDHAAEGAIVAVAAGSYVEDIQIRGRPVRLWGRCPALVEVVGTGAEVAALQILREGADRSEARSLAITGPGIGLGTSGASDVAVDRVWVHDTTGRGIVAESAFGPTSVAVRASLIEATTDIGLLVAGADATIEATVVRATQPRADGLRGQGINVQYHPNRRERAKVTLRTSLLEQNHEIGLRVASSEASVESTVIRDTLPRSDGTRGDGIKIEDDPSRMRAKATLRASLLEGNNEVGVRIYGSDVTIEATVIRGTRPSSEGSDGRGIEILSTPRSDPATLTLRASLLEQNHDSGVMIAGSSAMIEATVVRATQQAIGDASGAGIRVQGDPGVEERAYLALRTSILERNRGVGLEVAGADVAMEATIVRDTLLLDDGIGGEGVAIQYFPTTGERATAMIRASLVERNRSVGVRAHGADVTIEATVVRDTQPLRDGTLGQGIIAVIGRDMRARLALRTSLVEHNHDVGVHVAGSDATIEATVVRDTRSFGDDSVGDGIAVESGRHPASTVVITSSNVEANARAGISNFSAAVTLVSSTVRCSRIDLNGEDIEGRPFTFDGSKGNLCGCESPVPSCPVLSANLSPPAPIPPVRPSP